eukprot:gb/GECG01003580.1/.p1 GENE.gb/GECG01003580.1/~~gb/GECG01003580.1/.p1  ORF type:complete len:292 (+),score=4.55 gb/GECG01003580.1/:1-876(+)
MTIRRRAPFSNRSLYLYNEEHVEFDGIKNKSIRTGYRWKYSLRETLLSLFVLHNDTWNIWTHLLAFTCFLFLMVKLPAELPELASGFDTAVFSFYIATAQVCFFLSASYHLLRCISPKFYTLWYTLDLTGICCLIVGSYIIGVYNAFYCDQFMAAVYLGTLGTFIAVTMLFTLHPKYRGVEYDNFRVASLSGAVTFGIVPSIHWLIRCQSEKCPFSLIWPLIAMFLCYGIGFAFFATGFPEAYFPGWFDLHLSSHQCWHIMVFLAAFIWTFGMRDYFIWRLSHHDACPQPV